MTEPVMVGGGPAAASNKRALIMLGVAAVLAVLALVLPKLLFGGGDEVEGDLSELAVAAPADVLAPGTVAGAPEEVVAEPARTFEVFSTKNPFTALIDPTPVAAISPAPVLGAPVVPVPVAGPMVAPVSVAPAPAAPAGGAAPAIAPVAPVDAARAPTAGTPAATEPGSGQRVALLEVFVSEAGVTVASVRVNDTVHEVAEGTSFATRYRAVTLSVADGCGQFLYGDDRFRLCEGEELLK